MEQIQNPVTTSIHISKTKTRSMLNHIPFDIQTEIIKRLAVKPLIRFRSVSKTWKSLINSPKFVATYGIDHIQMRHILVPYYKDYTFMYTSFVDYDDDTFLFDQTIVHVLPREHNSYRCRILGSSHGLFGLVYDHTYLYDGVKKMYVIWNPSIRKSIGIDALKPLRYSLNKVYFGVCPVTRDPKLVTITRNWIVQIYTLSSGKWRKISNKLPRGTIKLHPDYVVTDRIMYWDATDSTTNGRFIVSFDLTSEEFALIDIPNYITNHKYKILKLRDTLVFLKYLKTAKVDCEVWMMMNNGVSKTFTKLYNIMTLNPLPNRVRGFTIPNRVRGFTNSGTPIIETGNHFAPDGLYVIEPNSERVTKIWFEEEGYGHYLCGLNVYTYQETLLLFDR
ncbi:putative F-box protein At1g32420 [Rutidosis leptorrhynchoides]|uniref:putative F-box protein At1g32420 n=1 Tax=Rutidosis leptorrhynchoides TaxID=125765 RepID=UPI003A998D0A